MQKVLICKMTHIGSNQSFSSRLVHLTREVKNAISLETILLIVSNQLILMFLNHETCAWTPNNVFLSMIVVE